MIQLPIWPLKLTLRIIPDSIHAQLLSHTFNHLMIGQSIDSRLEYLEGKRLWLSLTDTRNNWKFQIRHGQFHCDRLTCKPEIHLKGEMKYFLQLASRIEDPDTLFFARQLSIEGQTEDSLYLKNMLDAMEFDSEAHFKAFIGETLGVKLASVFNQLEIANRLNDIGKQLSH